MDGYQYIYCLPPAGGRIRSQGNYCLPPAGVWHSQNKVIKCAAYGVAQGRGCGFSSLVKQKTKYTVFCFAGKRIFMM